MSFWDCCDGICSYENFFSRTGLIFPTYRDPLTRDIIRPRPVYALRCILNLRDLPQGKIARKFVGSHSGSPEIAGVFRPILGQT